MLVVTHFRSGVYEFEYYNNNAEHCEPYLPEQMESLGYQTVHIGKLGVRIKTIKNGRAVPHELYQTDISFKQLRKDGLTGWGKDWFYEMDGEKLDEPFKSMEFFVTENGEFEYISERLEKEFPKYAGTATKAHEKYDLLRHYNKKERATNPIFFWDISWCKFKKSRENKRWLLLVYF